MSLVLLTPSRVHDRSVDHRADGARKWKRWQVVIGNKLLRTERLRIVLLGVWLHLGNTESSTLKVPTIFVTGFLNFKITYFEIC